MQLSLAVADLLDICWKLVMKLPVFDVAVGVASGSATCHVDIVTVKLKATPVLIVQDNTCTHIFTYRYHFSSAHFLSVCFSWWSSNVLIKEQWQICGGTRLLYEKNSRVMISYTSVYILQKLIHVLAL